MAAYLLCPLAAMSTGIYQEPEVFLEEVFAGKPPGSKRLWIDKDLRNGIHRIMDHDLGVLRIRYWERGGRTAWILEEIGKDKPITTGIVINNGEIEQIKILIFRETRGWEVRYPFFTDQFTGSSLTSDNELDKYIDGISGATLSVNALTRLARLALLLHQYIEADDDTIVKK